jgi:hypothetical protein
MTSDGEPARLKPPFEDVERSDAGDEVSGQYFWYGEPEQCLGDRLVAQTRVFRSVKSAMAASVASSFSATVGYEIGGDQPPAMSLETPQICSGAPRTRVKNARPSSAGLISPSYVVYALASALASVLDGNLAIADLLALVYFHRRVASRDHAGAVNAVATCLARCRNAPVCLARDPASL